MLTMKNLDSKIQKIFNLNSSYLILRWKNLDTKFPPSLIANKMGEKKAKNLYLFDRISIYDACFR